MQISNQTINALTQIQRYLDYHAPLVYTHAGECGKELAILIQNVPKQIPIPQKTNCKEHDSD